MKARVRPLPAEAEPRRRISTLRRWTAGRAWEAGLCVGLTAEILFFAAWAPGFTSGLLSLTQLFIPAGLVSLGLVVVVLMGEIDLSVGATAALVSVSMAALWRAGMNIWLAAALALVGSLLLGCINALLIVRLGIASLIATLATDFIFGSLAAAIAGSTPPYGFPSSFTYLGQDVVVGVPLQLILFIVAAAIIAAVIQRTRFGRDVMLMGANRPAARYVGVRTARTLFLGFMASALMAGLAGVLLGSYYGSVQPDIGDPLLLAAVTAVVLGGVDIFGGEGRILGVALAVMVCGFLQQGLLIKGYDSIVEMMATGILLVIVIALRMALRRSDRRWLVRLMRYPPRRQPADG